jgi:uncharacterized protein
VTRIARLADASEEIVAAVLDLNRRNVIALSKLDRVTLGHLISEAFQATFIGNGDAFLLAFDQDAKLSSPNFHWFRAHYGRFIYVDRVVVSEHARAKGLARLLYQDLFDAARSAGQKMVTCEVNVEPPNPVSDAFHAAFAFEEVGRDWLESGKLVRYLVKRTAG